MFSTCVVTYQIINSKNSSYNCSNSDTKIHVRKMGSHKTFLSTWTSPSLPPCGQTFFSGNPPPPALSTWFMNDPLYDRIIKAMETFIFEIASKERTKLTCTSQYPLYWTCNFISGTYNEAYFSRCLQIWEAFRLEKSCVKLTEMSPFQCVYWISSPFLYVVTQKLAKKICWNLL